MGRIIATVALAGCAIITWIAWHLANARIAVACGPDGFPNGACVASMEAKRDAVLTGGLVAGLLIVLVALVFYARARQQSPAAPTGWTVPANRGQQRRLLR